MLRTLDFFKLLIVISSLLALTARAQSSLPSIDERDAQMWLRKIQLAAHTLNYSGTFVYHQGNRVRASRITHVLEGQAELEKLEILDGKPREYIRRNDEVFYYAPESRTIRVEQRVAQDVFPAIIATGPGDLVPYYGISLGGLGRVAGFDCQLVTLKPKDKFRYGYRLWAEKSSGLLLRAQTIDENGNVIEQIAFVEIRIGNIDPAKVKPSYTDTRGWEVENAAMRQADLANWSIGSLPPGFKKIGAMKRVLSTGEEGADAAQSRQWEVVQIVFSDGLAAISVFIEPGSQSRTEGSLQQGAMHIVGKRLGEFWLTIVGEVPAAAIRQVANSIEFKNNIQKQ